ncbi:MAG: hypothetical protein ACYC56_02755 [Candidatus Aquicultor sp.]
MGVPDNESMSMATGSADFLMSHMRFTVSNPIVTVNNVYTMVFSADEKVDKAFRNATPQANMI